MKIKCDHTSRSPRISPYDAREVSGIQRHRRPDWNVDAATKWSLTTVDSGRVAPVASSVRNSSISAMPDVTQVDGPSDQWGQFIAGYVWQGRTHVSITTGTPTST